MRPLEDMSAAEADLHKRVAVCLDSAKRIAEQPVASLREGIRRVDELRRVVYEDLKKRFPHFLGLCDVQESASTDYAYRLFVQKPAWVQVLAGLSEETDYGNFKSEGTRHQGRAGAAYERSLHEVWSVMHGVQK
jgi:hypothetical protein